LLYGLNDYNKEYFQNCNFIGVENESNSIKFYRWETMWNRIADFFPNGPTQLLDVGSGQGLAIEFLLMKFPSMKATAIEQWKPLCIHIEQNLHSRAIQKDIEDEWPTNLSRKFDLIILRHTLEHVQDPNKLLLKVSSCLADNGLAYIVVPDSMNIKPGVRVLTSFFRPVDLSYFNHSTLLKITAKNRLTPIEYKQSSKGELWGVFKRSHNNYMTLPNSFSKQKIYLLNKIKENRKKELLIQIKFFVMRSMPNLYSKFKKYKKVHL
jgi:SAM-dependent methyltransferase